MAELTRGLSSLPCKEGSAPVLSDDDSKRLLRATEGKRFVVIGEDHKSVDVMAVLKPLIGSGRFRGIFLEALTRGNLETEGDRLKEGAVYYWNPVKYDQILAMAKIQNMEIHGIDTSVSFVDTREYKVDRVVSWASYINDAANKNGQYLVLVGEMHANYPDENKHPDTVNLQRNLFNLGIRSGEVLTVTSAIFEGERKVLVLNEFSTAETYPRGVYRGMADVVYTREDLKTAGGPTPTELNQYSSFASILRQKLIV